MKRSLYWKIMIPFMLLIIVCMGVMGIYLVNTIKNTQLDYLRESLVNEARLVGEDVRDSLMSPESSPGPDDIAKKVGKEIDARVTIISREGKVLGDSWESPLTMENHSTRQEVISALSSGVGESTRYSTTTGQNMFYVAISIIDDGQILGVARVSLPLTSVENSVNRTIRTISLAIAASAFLVILAAALITRMITRPVRKLTRAAVRIAGGDLDQHIVIESSDELGRLGHAFNKMSAKLKGTLETISEEKHKLSTILSTIDDGVILTDSQGKIRLSNPACESMFGFKQDQSTGKPLIEVIFNYEIESILKKCLASKQAQSAQLNTIDGKFLHIIVVPIEVQNLPGALLLFQDLTELRSLQTVRQEFIGNVSHELRTPLAGIKAIVETLQDGAIDEKEVAMDFLNKVNDEVDSLTQMVNELIELSRIETGKVKLNLQIMDLNSLIEEAAARLTPQAERKQLSLVLDLKDDLPQTPGDRERIQQVISNILHNAIKFTPAGGEIRVNTRSTSNMVSVEIKDTGIGISAIDLPHIFERFFKADKSRSNPGSGLGLAIAKHIVKAHGGEVWVKSQEGKGSTFGFSLPLTPR